MAEFRDNARVLTQIHLRLARWNETVVIHMAAVKPAQGGLLLETWGMIARWSDGGNDTDAKALELGERQQGPDLNGRPTKTSPNLIHLTCSYRH